MSFVRNAWYVAAWRHELGERPLARRILDVPVVFFRRSDGRPAALVDQCPHRLLPLSLGTVVGDVLQCGYHGMCFDGEGRCTRVPAQSRIPSDANVCAFPVIEHWGMVWIWMGDPALADPSRVFQALPWGEPGWTLNVGPYTHVKADYRLLIENLLDPVHVTYVHQSTLGTAAMADIPIETTQDGDTILVKRWTHNSPAAPILQRFGRWPGNVDRWQYYWWHAPSINVVDFGAHEVGSGESEAARQAGLRMYSNHFLTPETATTSHYFWCQLRNFAPGDEAVSSEITEQFITAFDEDKAILEAVQQASAEPLIKRPVQLGIDAGAVRMHRTLHRLISSEASDHAPTMLAQTGHATAH
jgi:phenylpropionate dioxygenase-like ring-hydroxylating dioxygenase large terminal subunit